MGSEFDVLVTGGAGFIGSHLCERLVGEGYRVLCLDGFSPSDTAAFKERNLRALQGQEGFTLVRGDILDAEALDGLFGAYRVGRVVHLAALAGVGPSVRAPARYARVNVEGTVNLLERARRHGVRQFVFGSTSAVYGSNQPPFSDDDPSPRPLSPYGASKLAAEVCCRTFHQLYGLPVTVLRFFTVYGPRQRPDMAIHKFARLMLEGRPVPIYGEGTSSRDYTYVGDIVEGIVRALERPFPWETFNLGNSTPVRLSELVRLLGERLGVPWRAEHLPEQPGDMSVTWADVSKARRLLGWQPQTPLDQGLQRFAAWLRGEGQEAPPPRPTQPSERGVPG
mgnify:CR=1 FL=1